MLIIDYLRSGKTPVDLEAQYGIVNRRHTAYPNLILLKYDQIDSPMGEDIVQECRGLILDESNEFLPVALPFGKFFNHGEGHAKEIDWETARVQEKLDGSLCTLWFYNGEWHVSTSGSPDAGGEVGNFKFTFKELFWKTFVECGYEVPIEEYRDYSFMFELTTKYNRVVVVHTESKVTLLAVRHRSSGSEISPYFFEDQYKVVRDFPLGSFTDIIETFSELDPIRQEGYIVVDGRFNRVKVKHPGYVALHHLKEGATSKNFLQIIRSGEQTEFLTYFPEWPAEFTDVKTRYDALAEHLDTEYARIKDIVVQKDFALEAVKTRFSGALFQLRSGKVKTMKESLANMTLDNLMVILGLKETKRKDAE